MSNWTIDQLLTPERERLKGEGISGTRRSPLLKSLIPIRTEFDDVKSPGAVEMDCVLHCGESLSGEYAETVNMLDIHTHWNEKRMIMNKTKGKVIGAFHRTRKNFPFPITSVDFDNGHEFVNWLMLGYCKRHEIAFTRSRSYHKNDQAHIEGKNYQSVRRITGYGRITDNRVIDTFNDLYENEHRLLTNFFYGTLKLKKKVKKDGKTHKKYETAKTPYERILKSKYVDIPILRWFATRRVVKAVLDGYILSKFICEWYKEVKRQLRKQYESLNPAALNRSLQIKLKKIKKLLR